MANFYARTMFSKEKRRVFRLLRSAAGRGSLDSMSALYFLYQKLAKNEKTAILYLMMAVNTNDGLALYNYGQVLYYGHSRLARDRAKAIEQFRQSSERGFSKADIFLSGVYESGPLLDVQLMLKHL